jgi:hypothetical protein
VKQLLKRIALLILTAGLLLQNLHAVAMPSCEVPWRADQPSIAHEHDDAVSTHEFHQHVALDADVVTGACDGCASCQTCSAPAVASVTLSISFDVISLPQPTGLSHFALFIPEQPHRPPLTP